MSFDEIFNVYLRRHKLNPPPTIPLPQEFRERVLLLFNSPHRLINYLMIDYFLNKVYSYIQFNVGKSKLSKDYNAHEPDRDLRGFLLDRTQCTNAQFLDFIECICQSNYYFVILQNYDNMFDKISTLFQIDGIPYAITRFVWEIQTDQSSGEQRKALVAYPTVIRHDDQFTHFQAIEPALTLLRDKQFTTANLEFLKALEDYRNGDYGDCLTKCNSAFESTMKIIRPTEPTTHCSTALPPASTAWRASKSRHPPARPISSPLARPHGSDSNSTPTPSWAGTTSRPQQGTLTSSATIPPAS
jgi:hypothetical protein